MDSLGSTLFSELSAKFFGILGSVNAQAYFDLIEVLEREMPTRGDSLDCSEQVSPKQTACNLLDFPAIPHPIE
jgi:hypothetical protein